MQNMIPFEGLRVCLIFIFELRILKLTFQVLDLFLRGIFSKKKKKYKPDLREKELLFMELRHCVPNDNIFKFSSI